VGKNAAVSDQLSAVSDQLSAFSFGGAMLLHAAVSFFSVQLSAISVQLSAFSWVPPFGLVQRSVTRG